MRKVPTQLSACWLEVYCHHHQDTGTKNDTLSFVAVIPRDSNLLWWRIYRYLGFVKNNKSIIRVVCCFLPISSSTTIYIYIYIYKSPIPVVVFITGTLFCFIPCFEKKKKKASNLVGAKNYDSQKSTTTKSKKEIGRYRYIYST